MTQRQELEKQQAENQRTSLKYLVLHQHWSSDFHMYIVLDPLPETKAALDSLKGVVINGDDEDDEVKLAAYEIIFGGENPGRCADWQKASIEEVYDCRPDFVVMATFLL